MLKSFWQAPLFLVGLQFPDVSSDLEGRLATECPGTTHRSAQQEEQLAAAAPDSLSMMVHHVIRLPRGGGGLWPRWADRSVGRQDFAAASAEAQASLNTARSHWVALAD